MQNLGIDILLEWVTIRRLLEGLLFTLEVSITAIIMSFILGSFFGIIRISNNIWIRGFFKIYLDVIRILPTLVLLYILYYFLPGLFNFEISGFLVGMIVFVVWGSAEMSDIIRGAIISLPKHQTESALSIGLNKKQLFRYILLPQALKQSIPPILNLAVRMIMTTSILALIGVRELVKVGKEIIEIHAMTNPVASFWIYGIILLLFFTICYHLSKLAQIFYKQQD